MLSHLPFTERIYHGPRLSLLVLGRHDIETAQINVPYAVVSITDPEREAATLAESPNAGRNGAADFGIERTDECLTRRSQRR